MLEHADYVKSDGDVENVPFKELGDLVTAGCLSITACCLSTRTLGGGVLLSSSSLCFLALLSVSGGGRVGRTSSCGSVVGSYLDSELALGSLCCGHQRGSFSNRLTSSSGSLCLLAFLGLLSSSSGGSITGSGCCVGSSSY